LKAFRNSFSGTLKGGEEKVGGKLTIPKIIYKKKKKKIKIIKKKKKKKIKKKRKKKKKI